MYYSTEETRQSDSLKSKLNFSEIQHVLLWKERPMAQSGAPAVTAQCQVLQKTFGNCAGTFVWDNDQGTCHS